jgi:WD40 repeat protein
MRKLVMWISMIVLTAFPVIGAAQGCPADFAGFAEPRLTTGGEGVVMPGSPNRVRSAPDTSGSVVGELPAGTRFRVMDGPACSGDIVWWQVEATQVSGWTAESAGGSYFLEPTGDSGSVRLPEVPPVPADAPQLPNVVLDSSAVHITFTGGETLLIAVTTEPGKVDMWDIDQAASFEISMAPQDSPIIYYKENLQPDGQGGDVILTGDIQGRVFFWNPFFMTYTEEPIQAALLETYFPVYAASPTDDFTFVAVGGCFEASRDAGCSLGGAEVYDFSGIYESEVSLAFEVSGHTAEIVAMDIDPTNSLLATAGADGVVMLWSLDDGSLISEIAIGDLSVDALDFGPDGETVAVSICGVVQGVICLVGNTAIYTADGETVWTVAAHAGTVNTVDFDADGARLATGGMDGIVRVWDAADGGLLQTFAPAEYRAISDVRFFDLFNEIAIAGASEIGIFPLE